MRGKKRYRLYQKKKKKKEKPQGAKSRKNGFRPMLTNEARSETEQSGEKHEHVLNVH